MNWSFIKNSCQKQTAVPFIEVYRNRGLLLELVKRDFAGRYKGSFLGIAWSFIKPLIMLGIYTIVFGVAFKARWGTVNVHSRIFSIILFSGLIVHNFFSECLTRAPLLILENPNFVKKVVFPLEILPWMALISSLLHFALSFAVLMIFCIIFGVPIYGGMLLIPVILLPLVLMTIGLTLFLSSIGVYLRDISQITGTLSTITLFLAPVFYPIHNLPNLFQKIVLFNPITLPILQLRDVVLMAKPINWHSWTLALATGIIISTAGHWWFQKTRNGFSDVL